jgi:hypothetical protein
VDTRYKACVTSADHRLLLWPETGERRLFDLREDPGETADVAASFPAVAEDLSRKLARWLLVGDRMPGEAPREDVDEALRGLGYDGDHR